MFLENFSEKHIQSLVHKSLILNEKEVIKCLQKKFHQIDDLPYLLSPHAAKKIEYLAFRSRELTRQRFGNEIQLFAPIYLSNECFNHCSYCGFGIQHDYHRKTLSEKEIHTEASFLRKKGFQHIIVLTGESPKKVGVDYISNAINILKKYFSSISIEIQPLSYADYKTIRKAGADHLILYQESYHKMSYQKHHLSGFKKFYDKRLKAVEDGAKSGFHSIALGSLLGLYNWRFEALSLAHHIHYMKKKYWQTHYHVSFPRITKMFGSFEQLYPCSDIDFSQLIFAFRLIYPEIGITLSTRESPKLRDGLLSLGITSLSAESSTAPGGYTSTSAVEQFSTHDQRSLKEIKDLLLQKGFEPMMKNWDTSLCLR